MSTFVDDAWFKTDNSFLIGTIFVKEEEVEVEVEEEEEEDDTGDGCGGSSTTIRALKASFKFDCVDISIKFFK